MQKSELTNEATGARLSKLERTTDKLLLLQEVTTKNIDSLSRDIKSIIEHGGISNTEISKLTIKCDASHRRIDDLERELQKKANADEVKNISNALSRIMWIVISSILVGVLNVILGSHHVG